MTILPFPGTSGPNLDFLEELNSIERIQWAHDIFGKKLALTTSFGIQSAVLLHQATQVNPKIPVVFVDTGYLFNETYDYAKELADRLKLNLHVYSAHRSPYLQEAFEGRRWESGDKRLKEAFDLETKVEPLNRAMKELGAKGWLSGLRRAQSDRRANLDVTEQQGNVLKLYPLIDWSSRETFQYMKKHNLPQHPLFEQGYSTVGNWFDSAPGQQRGECGIHVPQAVERPGDYII